MNDKDKKSIASSIGKVIGWLCKLATTVFIVLRACDITDWTWWKVMMPTIIGAAFSLLMLLICGVAVAIASTIDD